MTTRRAPSTGTNVVSGPVPTLRFYIIFYFIIFFDNSKFFCLFYFLKKMFFFFEGKEVGRLDGGGWYANERENMQMRRERKGARTLSLLFRAVDRMRR